jgi:hypothetical protein
MKINYPLLSIIIFAIVVEACSSAKESTGVWINKDKIQGKSFNKIFIVAMTADITARAKLENGLADAAISKGYNAVKSIDVMPPTLGGHETPSQEEIANKVKESGCDAVFVTSLLRSEEDVRYTPGSSAYSVMPYYSWAGRYSSYYRRWYPTVYSPAYYTNERTYFMQSNLYDAASQEIMWSVQSKVFAPSSLDGFSKEYTSGLIKQLENENLLKK